MSHDIIQAALTVQASASSTSKRTITGKIVSFTETGLASSGPTRFTAGSLAVPADLSAVKLLIQHDTYAAALGYMIAYDETAEDATATFYVAPGADGDAALAAAKDGTRDGLSVGTTITDYGYGDDGNTIIVLASTLREVSLVTLPAFASARVTTVTAAHNQEGTTMTTTPKPTPPAGPAPAPVTVTAAQTEPDPAPEAPTLQTVTAAQVAPVAPAIVNQVQVIPPARDSLTLDQVTAAFAEGHRRGQPLHALTAALNDIIPANDAGGASIGRPQWENQLWQASRARRPFIDAHGTPKPLTSLKVQGWQFDLDNLPTIDPYAGDKAAIPTSNIGTKPIEAAAVRRAGGWDFDRAFIDLGDGSFITSTLAFALDDYKRQSEAYVVEQLLAKAVTITAGANFAATLAGLGIAAVTLGANLDIISMSSDQWLAFAALKENEVPWWLRSHGDLNIGTTSGNAGGLSFECDPELADGTILAADKRAYTVHEKSPIQVEALNIPNGGVDLGVFAYLAAYVNDPRAVLKVVTPAP